MPPTVVQQTLPTLRKPLSLPIVWRLALSGVGVVFVTLGLLPFRADVQPPTISLLYILVVLISAINFGLWPGLGTSVLAFFAFNFFFVPPYHALGVTSVEDATRLIVFLSVALLASGLAGYAHKHAISATQRAAELETLYSLSQTISAEVDLKRILPIIAQTTTLILPVPACQILLYDEYGNLEEHAHSGVMPPEIVPIDIDVRQSQQSLGILRVGQPAGHAEFTPSERAVLQTIAIQVILVLERARLVAEAGQVRALADSNRLKSTLLSSISHDLRTPLAAIKGAVTNLLDTSINWEQTAREEFLTTINEETDRLNRLVGDLLEMSRIEVGALQQTLSWHDLGELIEDVVGRMQPRFTQQRIAITLPVDVPPIQFSYTQIDHVLTNLLENALHYTPAGSVIEVVVDTTAQHVQIEVLDRGPGIPEAMLDRVFDKFVRGVEPERHAGGSGLGLAICKGLVEAHAGEIWAANRAGGGARFGFRLPLKAAPFSSSGGNDNTASMAAGGYQHESAHFSGR